MAKDISKPFPISDEDYDYLDRLATKQQRKVDDVVTERLAALVAEVKRQEVFKWWDTLTLDQKVALYNANK